MTEFAVIARSLSVEGSLHERLARSAPRTSNASGQAYGRAVGNSRPLSELARDSGLRTILMLLAAGYPAADLEWVAASVPAQPWWRCGDRVRGLARLSVEVVSRALAERSGPAQVISPIRNRGASGEDRRIHRNTLLENAEAGRYGTEIRRAARSGVGLRELVDEFEWREAAAG